MVFEIVNEEVDLLGQAAGFFQQLAEFGRKLFGDSLAEFLTAAKMLVGGTAIEARALGDLDDGQPVRPTFGEEVASGGDQGLV